MDSPPGRHGRSLLPRGLRAGGRADQRADPHAVRRTPGPLRRDPAGTKQLADVRKELEDALARELLDKIARLEQRRTPVEFTGEVPHFKPGTRELVMP